MSCIRAKNIEENPVSNLLFLNQKKERKKLAENDDKKRVKRPKGERGRENESDCGVGRRPYALLSA